MERLFAILLLCVVLAWRPAWTATLPLAISPTDLDLPHCQAFDGLTPMPPVTAETLQTLLGLHESPGVKWETAETAGKDRCFRVAFTAPVAIGTIYTSFASGLSSSARFQQGIGASISYLKADVPAPGDIANDDQWVKLPAGSLVVLPPGVKTRALRFRDRYLAPVGYPSKFTFTLLFAERYYSALNIGQSKQTGVKGKPDVWYGAWNDPQEIAGMLLTPFTPQLVQVDSLKPEATEHPTVAAATAWKRQPDSAPGFARYALYPFDKPVATRGLRLTVPVRGDQATFTTVLPLVRLGDRPDPPSLQTPPPPYKIQYTMPMDGFAALEIHDKTTGKLVRRLIGEVPRDKGLINEPWDLKDDNGQYVPPGIYTWKAITRPPFRLTYELTVNNAGQPAWWAPPPGKGGGGWLADHSAPIAACTVSDLVFLGSPVSESGQSLIAVDKDGNKQWGEGALQLGFFGPHCLAGDSRYAYLIKENFIQRVDTQQEFKTATIFDERLPRDLPGWPIGGAATHAGKLYISYNAPPVSWLQPSFSADLLDPKRSVPMIWLQKGNGHRGGRGEKNYGEAEYDELMRFYAAFLTGNMPDDCPSLAGVPLPSSSQGYFGDAPAAGSLAGNVVAVFKTPVPVGSILVPDGHLHVFALKPGVKVPDDMMSSDTLDPEGSNGGDEGGPFKDEDWVELPVTGKAGQPGIALTPNGGIVTQALRFKTRRLQYALVLSHRLTDVAAQAERLFTEGAITEHGGWRVTRDAATPITPFNPVMMALQWKAPVTLRGVSLNLATPYSTTAVDYWVGPVTADPKTSLTDDACWHEAGRIVPQVFNGYFAQEPVISNVDFGALVPTRAVRVRILEPEDYRHPPYGNRPVTPPHKAGFEAIVAYQHLGEDPTLPEEWNARITEFQLPAKDDVKPQVKIQRHLHVARPGYLTFDKTGVLYTVSDDQIVTVPLAGDGAPKVIVSREEMRKPTEILHGVQRSLYADYSADNGLGRFTGLVVDTDGLLYVGDREAQVIKVFDSTTGKFLRVIGTPGGPQLGPWDATRLQNPAGMTLDANGKLWLAENNWQPKRITRWSRDGKLEKQFLGPTQYGGGGQLDPGDRNVLNFDGMKFVIDWPTRSWKLDSVLYCQALKGSIYGARPDRPVYRNGQRFLVGDPAGSGSYFSVAIPQVCVERNGVAVPVAAAGNLALWGDVDRYPDLRKQFGALERERYGFCWWDKNGDGVPELNEVQVSDKNPLIPSADSKVGEDLSLNFGAVRLRPTSFTANGLPQYDLDKLEATPALTGNSWTTADGRTFVVRDRLFTPDGKTLQWEFYDKYLGGDGYYEGGMGYNRPTGMLYAESKVIGHFTVGKEEYFVTSSDQGDWFVFTGDGMLTGCIFGGPSGYGLRQWTMPEWEPGKVDLTDLRIGQEHYQGCVTTTNDGKVYAVAGHNHNSIVHVDGLEQLQRLNGEVTVGKDDIAKCEGWVLQKAATERSKQEPKVAKMPYLAHAPVINGSLDDWPDDLFFNIHDFWQHSLTAHEFIIHSQAALAYDADNLYIAAWMLGDTPLKNSAQDPVLLFKNGFALDVLLGLDPKADPTRTSPAPGDMRILISQLKNDPIAMLYKHNAPGTPPEKRKHFQSPVGEIFIDNVEQITDADIAFKQEADSKGTTKWCIEAAIPWKALGVKAPPLGTHLRGDVGLLQSDQNGMRTINRLYWSGKSQTVVSDIPSEARIVPSVWGDIYTVEPDAGMKFGPEESGDLAP